MCNTSEWPKEKKRRAMCRVRMKNRRRRARGLRRNERRAISSTVEEGIGRGVEGEREGGREGVQHNLSNQQVTQVIRIARRVVQPEEGGRRDDGYVCGSCLSFRPALQHKQKQHTTKESKCDYVTIIELFFLSFHHHKCSLFLPCVVFTRFALLPLPIHITHTEH